MERWFERMEPGKASPIRSALAQRLSARAFEQHRDDVIHAMTDILGGIRDDVPFDLVADFAAPLVRGCVARVVGVRAEQRALFDDVIGPMCAELFSDAAPQTALLVRWAGMIQDIVDRDGDGDHLVGDLLRARRNGDDLDRTDLTAFTAQFADAAYENITNFIGNAILVLRDHPDVWDALAADPSAVSATIEELLRFASPINYVPLVAREDIATAGHVVKRGSTVLACLPLANHDGAQFPDARCLDRGRRPNHHVSFGMGPYACIGASFARVQAALAIQGLAARFEVPRLVLDKIQPKKSRLFYGPERLPAILTRRKLPV